MKKLSPALAQQGLGPLERAGCAEQGGAVKGIFDVEAEGPPVSYRIPHPLAQMAEA